MAWGVIAPAVAQAGLGIWQANEQRHAAENANITNREIANETASRNEALQREFAQHGLRWKVEDAKRAGIHPLYALGGSGASFSPSSTIGVDPVPNSLPSVLSDMGQNITRGVAATRTAEEKMMASLQLANARTELEGRQIDNAIRAHQLNNMGNKNPSFPDVNGNFIPGQGNSGPIKNKPMERTATLPGHGHAEPGAVGEVGYAYTGSGALVPVPSKDVKERIEDNIFHEAGHFFRNNVLPNVGGGRQPPKSALPRGYDFWKWSYKEQGYVPMKYPGWLYRTDGR